MKRSLISLLVIGVVGVAAVGLSQAFFSDSETSTGNTFTAGALDLKVDHKFTSYNGQECTENCTPTGENLLTNGDFETPVVSAPQLWDIFPSVAGGWTVDWTASVPPTFNSVARPTPANLELHRKVNGWLPQSGDQHSELDSDWQGPTGSLNNEPATVKIYQDIATTPGAKYEIKFYHSPRPATASSQNSMTVRWEGTDVATVTDDGTGDANTTWTPYTYQKVATGSTTRLEFEAGGPADSLGVFLDNVSVRLMNCSGTINGNTCTLWQTEKDLGSGDLFFNLTDIKPGDYGVDVVSLHVFDNNAWACSIVKGTDDENGLTQPEINVGDLDNPEGELSQYLNVFIWHDNNFNGVYEPALLETSVYGSGPFVTNLPLAQPPSSALVASTLNYYGFAWCVGTQTVNGDGSITCNGSGAGNDAQTDVFTADIKFYAEQERNNPDFLCSSVVI